MSPPAVLQTAPSVLWVGTMEEWGGVPLVAVTVLRLTASPCLLGAERPGIS